MINAQHAHIYRIHTLHFIFGEIFFLKILLIQPLVAATSALITLSTTANVGRPALQTITVPVAVSVLPAAGVAALPLPPRDTQKTSHHEQIARQNKRKHRAVHAQAHAPKRGRRRRRTVARLQRDCAGRGGVQGTGLSCDDE